MKNVVDQYNHFTTNYTSKSKKLAYPKMLTARIYVAFSLLISTLTMIFEPISVQARSAVATQAPAIWMYAALVLCFLAVLDVIINDLSPKKYELKFAYDKRHIVYMLLAVLSFSISVSVVITFGASFLVARLWLDGVIAAIVALLDVFSRHGGNSDTTIYIHPN